MYGHKLTCQSLCCRQIQTGPVVLNDAVLSALSERPLSLSLTDRDIRGLWCFVPDGKCCTMYTTGCVCVCACVCMCMRACVCVFVWLYTVFILCLTLGCSAVAIYNAWTVCIFCRGLLCWRHGLLSLSFPVTDTNATVTQSDTSVPRTAALRKRMRKTCDWTIFIQEVSLTSPEVQSCLFICDLVSPKSNWCTLPTHTSRRAHTQS